MRTETDDLRESTMSQFAPNFDYTSPSLMQLHVPIIKTRVPRKIQSNKLAITYYATKDKLVPQSNTKKSQTPRKWRKEVKPVLWSDLNDSLYKIDENTTKIPSIYSPLQITSTFKFEDITFMDSKNSQQNSTITSPR